MANRFLKETEFEEAIGRAVRRVLPGIIKHYREDKMGCKSKGTKKGKPKPKGGKGK
jgi:hypothetical protein